MVELKLIEVIENLKKALDGMSVSLQSEVVDLREQIDAAEKDIFETKKVYEEIAEANEMHYQTQIAMIKDMQLSWKERA